MTGVPTASHGSSTALKVLGASLVAGGGLAWLIVFALFALVVPRFEEIFLKFDIKGGLPALTQALIAVSHVIKTWWYAWVPIGVLAMVALVGACLVCQSRAGFYAAAAFAALSLLVAFATPVLLVVGMFLPLVDLVQDVGTPA
jgi:hypothetical protein